MSFIILMNEIPSRWIDLEFHYNQKHIKSRELIVLHQHNIPSLPRKNKTRTVY